MNTYTAVQARIKVWEKIEIVCSVESGNERRPPAPGQFVTGQVMNRMS